MPSENVSMEWLLIGEGSPDDQFGSYNYARISCDQYFGTKGIALLQCTLPGSLPSTFSVANQRVETDQYGSGGSGSAQIRQASGGFYKYDSTFNHLQKSISRSWKAGPFSSADYGTIYWSGALNDVSIQTHNCNTSLSDYIKAAGASGFIGLCVISFSGSTLKDINGARLKFDWVDTTDPLVTGFTPDEMDYGETPLLTISGYNFVGTLTSVQLIGSSNYSLTSPTIVNQNTITGTVPSGVATGDYIIRVNISGKDPADSSQSFSVNAVDPTITQILGPDGENFIKNHYKKKLTLMGTNLGSPTSITLIGQEGQGNHVLTNVTGVSATEVYGIMPDPPLAPGKYKAKVVVSLGTVYSGQFDVSLGPDWWI